MGFGLKPTSVILDDNEFQAYENEETNQHYFAERIAIKGELAFGVVPEGKETRIDLEDNGITAPVMLTELFAFTSNGTSDEVWLILYVKNGDNLIRIGAQKISAGQMPYNVPNGILHPNMVIGVIPTKSDSTVIAYTKPVAIAFRAVPNPATATTASDSSGDSSKN